MDFILVNPEIKKQFLKSVVKQSLLLFILKKHKRKILLPIAIFPFLLGLSCLKIPLRPDGYRPD